MEIIQPFTTQIMTNKQELLFFLNKIVYKTGTNNNFDQLQVKALFFGYT